MTDKSAVKHEGCLVLSRGPEALNSFFLAGQFRPSEFFKNFLKEPNVSWLDSLPLPLVYAQVLNKYLGLRASKIVVPSEGASETLVKLEMRCRHDGNENCPTWASLGSGLDQRSALDAAAVRWIRTLFFMTRERCCQISLPIPSVSIRDDKRIQESSALYQSSCSPSSTLSPDSPEFYPSSYTRGSKSDSSLFYASHPYYWPLQPLDQVSSGVSKALNTYHVYYSSVNGPSYGTFAVDPSCPQVSAEDSSGHVSPPNEQIIQPHPLLMLLPNYSPQYTVMPTNQAPSGPQEDRVANMEEENMHTLKHSENKERESWRSSRPSTENGEPRSFGTRCWSNRRRRRRNHQRNSRSKPPDNHQLPETQPQTACYEFYWVPQTYQYPYYQYPYFLYPVTNYQTIESTIQSEY